MGVYSQLLQLEEDGVEQLRFSTPGLCRRLTTDEAQNLAAEKGKNLPGRSRGLGGKFTVNREGG